MTPTPWRELRERKLVQWTLAYLAGAWAMLQVVGFLADSFEWPKVVPQVATVVLGVGLFVVLVLAWYHGDRGEQRVSRAELALLLGLTGFMVGGVAWVMSSPVNDEARISAVLPVAPTELASIAVLPFDNLSSNAENAYFADGMMEDVLTRLSQIQNLRVISRTSVEGYRETTKPMKQIGEELGVEHVVEGSVRRDGNRVRIRAQLSQASTDQPLWANSFDRDLTDIFAVQSEISQEIAEALRIELSRGEQVRLQRKPTENLAAYDLFLRGREAYSNLLRDDNERAIRLFQRALELDPSFHLAAVRLSGAYVLRYTDYGFGPEWADSAVALSERIVALQPEFGEAHYALGFALRSRGDLEGNEREYRRAVELDPALADLVSAGLAFTRGDLVRQLEAYEPRRAGTLPFNSMSNLIQARIFIGDLEGAKTTLDDFARRFPELEDQRLALAAFLALARGDGEEVLRLARSLRTATRTRDNIDARIATSLLYSGYVGEAKPFLERAVSDRATGLPSGIPNALVLLGYVRWREGDRTGAGVLFEQWDSVSQRGGATSAGQADYARAAVAATEGRNEDALLFLDRAVRAGWMGWQLGRYNPMFSGLRGNPRYEALMTEAKANIDRQRAEARRLGL